MGAVNECAGKIRKGYSGLTTRRGIVWTQTDITDAGINGAGWGGMSGRFDCFRSASGAGIYISRLDDLSKVLGKYLKIPALHMVVANSI